MQTCHVCKVPLQCWSRTAQGSFWKVEFMKKSFSICAVWNIIASHSRAAIVSSLHGLSQLILEGLFTLQTCVRFDSLDTVCQFDDWQWLGFPGSKASHTWTRNGGSTIEDVSLAFIHSFSAFSSSPRSQATETWGFGSCPCTISMSESETKLVQARLGASIAANWTAFSN